MFDETHDHGLALLPRAVTCYTICLHLMSIMRLQQARSIFFWVTSNLYAYRTQA